MCSRKRSSFLKLWPPIILDEPTSALDPESERALVGTLDEVRQDHLVIVIAHRLSTIRHADRIFFMRAGRLIEQGSHDELMAKKDGEYRRFVALSTGVSLS